MTTSVHPTKAFVLLSGGIDSTTCLALAIDQFGEENVEAFLVRYGQRHLKELYSAKQVTEHYGIPRHFIDLGPQPVSNLTNPDAVIPKVSYDQLGEGMSPSYHYFRNGQFLSAAAAHAVSMLKEGQNGVLYCGVHAEDAQNWAYADCTPEFIGAMANAIFIGTYQRLRLKAPLLEMTKNEIVLTGDDLAVPYHITWSCYLGGDIHCGTCPTCRARKEAFRKAGVVDLTTYSE